MWKVRKADTGKVYGASDLRTLQAWCREGRVREDDFVRSDEDADWRLAARVFELAAHFASLREPTAPGPRRAEGRGRAAVAAGVRAQRRTPRTAARRDRGDEEINPDLTSMMDMAFILVILLMVISTPAFQHGMEVKLPEAGSSDAAKKSDLVVALSEAGEIAVGDQKLSGGVGELTEELKKRRPEIKAGKTKLILRADKDCRHGEVIRVMDAIVKAGIKDVSVATRPKQD